jgi:hypothetical protein
VATFSDLVTICREEFLDDDVEPYRHSDTMLLRLARDAEMEACRRGSCKLIFDDTLTLRLVADVRSYALDPILLRLDRVLWTNTAGDQLLEKTSEQSLDDWDDWRNQSAGSPSRYFIHGRTLYLERVPTAEDVAQDATLNLQGWRLPITYDVGSSASEIASIASDEPEINAVNHLALCHWMAYRALSRPDEDTFKKELAMQNLALFELAFGKPVDASTLEYQLASVGQVTHSNADYRDHWRKQASDWLAELG